MKTRDNNGQASGSFSGGTSGHMRRLRNVVNHFNREPFDSSSISTNSTSEDESEDLNITLAQAMEEASKQANQESDGKHYILFGGPSSPYSFKLRAVLRYRRLPLIYTPLRGIPFSQVPLFSKANSRQIPILLYPNGTYRNDSTPIIYDLERLHSERKVVPPDPALAFLSHLIEDFADELFVKSLFYYKWASQEDIKWCSRRQAIGWLGAAPEKILEVAQQSFQQRQTTILSIVCGPESNYDFYLCLYRTVLQILETHFQKSLFFFGTRPSLAEFGLFGQLFVMSQDHSSSQMMRKEFVRVYQWCQILDDAASVEGTWADRKSGLPNIVPALLSVIFTTYMPMMKAIIEVIEQKSGEPEKVEFLIDAERSCGWKGKFTLSGLHLPPVQYHYKCWQDLKTEYHKLSKEDQEYVITAFGKDGTEAAKFFEQ